GKRTERHSSPVRALQNSLQQVLYRPFRAKYPWDRSPRASPWADLLRPYRGKESSGTPYAQHFNAYIPSPHPQSLARVAIGNEVFSWLPPRRELLALPATHCTRMHCLQVWLTDRCCVI